MIAWAIETAVAVSALILIVLLVRRPVARWFGAHAAFALWLAPLLRLVMPPISLPTGVPPAFGGAGSGSYQIVVAKSAAGWPFAELGLTLWIAGAVAFLAWHLWRHHRFVGAAVHAGRPLLRPDVRYDLVATPLVAGPLATGLVSPLILVPDDFERRFTDAQQRFALWHEQLHHRRGDLWSTAAALLVTALLWFNPLAHLALRAFRRDMEAACDASLLAQAGRNDASAYAETIVRCASRPVPRSLCALTTIDELKGRLIMLGFNHGPARRIIGLAVASAITVGGIATASAAQEQDKQTKVFEKRITIKNGDRDVLKRGEPGEFRELAAKCEGEKFEVDSAGGTANRTESMKFFLCTDKGEKLLPALEKAATDIEKNDDFSAERKAELLAKLRAKIAELRARG